MKSNINGRFLNVRTQKSKWIDVKVMVVERGERERKRRLLDKPLKFEKLIHLAMVRKSIGLA